jgi:hypothetical protein
MKAPEVAAKAVEFFGSNKWVTITAAGTAAYKILEDMLGRKAPENAPEEVKSLYGIFGKGDEIAFMRDLLLQDDDKKRILSKREQESIIGFLQWHFFANRRRSPLGALTVWWVGNSWRTFVTKLKTQGRKTSVTDTSTSNYKGKSVEDKKTVEMFGPDGSQTIDFLKMIAKIIISAPDTETGYQRVLEVFEAAGVPHMPKRETIEWIEDNLLNVQRWISAITALPAASNQKITDRNAARASTWQGRLANFVDKLI